MTATPDQRLTAKARRGYSKDYLNQTCNCGCSRAAHKDRSGACVCGCSGFSMGSAAAQPAGAAPVERNYSFGTVVQPRLPAGLREIREDINTHETVTESGIRRAVALDEGVASVVAREGTATRCPFCMADDFESIPAVKCPTCKAWQHSDCVREAGRCSACNTAWPAA
jgi:hypothetical protein